MVFYHCNRNSTEELGGGGGEEGLKWPEALPKPEAMHEVPFAAPRVLGIAEPSVLRCV